MFECFLSVLPHNPFISVFSCQFFSHYIYLVSVRVLRLALKFQGTWVMSQSCKCDAAFHVNTGQTPQRERCLSIDVTGKALSCSYGPLLKYQHCFLLVLVPEIRCSREK